MRVENMRFGRRIQRDGSKNAEKPPEILILKPRGGGEAKNVHAQFVFLPEAREGR